MLNPSFQSVKNTPLFTYLHYSSGVKTGFSQPRLFHAPSSSFAAQNAWMRSARSWVLQGKMDRAKAVHKLLERSTFRPAGSLPWWFIGASAARSKIIQGCKTWHISVCPMQSSYTSMYVCNYICTCCMYEMLLPKHRFYRYIQTSIAHVSAEIL